jgi:tetratricopeptide (TPR) repeat protein
MIQSERKGRGVNMSEAEIVVATTLAKAKEQVETLKRGVTEVIGALDTILRAAEAVRDQTVQTLARTAKASFAETRALLDAAREECERLEGLGPQIAEEPGPEIKAAGLTRQITQEAGAKITQIMGQYVNRLINADVLALLELSRNLVASLPPNSPTAVMQELAKEAGITGVSIDSLDTLSGVDFERLVSQLLERMGFRAEMTKASGDGGVDVVANLDQPFTGGRYLIQCKRYAPDSTVGAATVREFYGALNADRRAIKGILITTSAFTAQATEFAQGLPIELIARDKLQELLGRHGLLQSSIPGVHALARLHSAYRSIAETLADLGPANSSLAELRSAWESTVQKLPDFLRPAPRGAVCRESPQPRDRAKALLESAMKLRNQKRDAEAIKLLREAAQLQPDDPDVWLWLGICYHFAGLHDDQIEALRSAVRLKPDFHDAWHWLGEGLHCVGDLDAAVDALRQANTISPDDAYTWLELGNIHYDRACKNVPATGGRALQGSGFDAALVAYQNAAKLKPDIVLTWQRIGSIHCDRGETGEAVSAYKEALRIDPDNANSWELVFYAYSKLDDRPRMRQVISRLMQLAPGTAQRLQRDFRRQLAG